MRIDAMKVVALAVLAAMVGVADAQPKTGGGSGSGDPPAGGTGTPPTGTPAGSPTGTPTGTPAPGGDPATAPGTAGGSEETPVAVRLRSLEQKVQALKERAWRAKARVGILKEDAIGGGVGASAIVIHRSKMSAPFRLVKLVYAIDGAQLFVKNDETAEVLYKTKAFEIINGPIAPGSHTLSVVAVYKGHGIGPFKYLDKYQFQVQASHSFTVEEGKGVRVECDGREKGGPKTPMEDRPEIKCTTVQVQGK